ncbi:MAG TPA: M20/M25/M40 family metallo-hydrolase [Candidatus Acidoferrales bacterium]|nr:M20/M25/M40 family metallo-hydrolase [Candidatus Acidoferrales bacterium]
MKQRRSLLAAAIGLFLLVAWLAIAQGPPQQAPADPLFAADQKIMAEIKDNSELMANLEYLTDMIGPRVTGTKQMNQASTWTMEMFKKYGLANAHLEPWTIARAWYRGTAGGHIVSPVEHPLTLASAGWSPSTPGKIRGPVVYVSARTVEDLQQYKGKLKGAIVMTTAPGATPPPYEAPRSPLLGPGPAPAPPGPPAAPQPFAGQQQFNRERDAFFKAEGVAAALRDSDKDHGLLNMSSVGGRDYNIGPFPTAFLSPESYRLIARLLKRGPVEIELQITNSFSDKPVEVYNTVAEIPGSELPNEVVIIGGHLDSWDLGTGATDNGTGTMAVLEAARALVKLDLKPRRTIRFVLFSGEEQGLNGSRLYAEAHKAELSKISGVLVHDTGTGRVLTLGLHGNYQAREVMDRVTAPLRTIGLTELSLRSSGGTDHASFNAVGVPGFYCIQDPYNYRKTHHSQSDTFEQVVKDDIVQGAQVLAVWAYNVAQLPEMLPRRPAPAPQQRPASSQE